MAQRVDSEKGDSGLPWLSSRKIGLGLPFGGARAPLRGARAPPFQLWKFSGSPMGEPELFEGEPRLTVPYARAGFVGAQLARFGGR